MEYLIEFEHAKKLVIKAGEFLKGQSIKKIESFEGKDIKLVLDKRVDKMILKDLQKFFIHPVVSEESGTTKKKIVNEPYWIVDPIDGTLNYFKGIPFCCVSLALWINEEPVFGVVYDFNRDELFNGYVGIGSWLNETQIVPKGFKKKSQSILATGFSTYMNFDEATLQSFIFQIQDYKKIRIIGSAALSLAYLSIGRVDSYMEKNIKLWDVAAGIAILKALGKNPHDIIFKENNLIDIKISN